MQQRTLCETEIDDPEAATQSLLTIREPPDAGSINGVFTRPRSVSAAQPSAHTQQVQHSNSSVATQHTHRHRLVRRMTSESDESATRHLEHQQQHQQQQQQESRNRRASAYASPRMQPVNEEHLQSSSSYGSYGGYSQDRRKGFGRRAQTMEIDELLDPAESIELLVGVPPKLPLPPKTQKKFAVQQLDSIESDCAEGTHGGGAVGGAATASSRSASVSAAATSSGRASAPPLQRQRTNEEPEHLNLSSIRILITPSSMNEMHRIEQDDKNAPCVGGGAVGGGLGGSMAASDTTSSQPDTTRPQGQLLEPPAYVKRTHPRMKALERSMSVAQDDQRRGPLAWRLNKQKSLNECDIMMALDPATSAAVEAAQSSKGVSFRVHWGRRISNMLGHGWTSLSGSGMVGGLAGGGVAGGQQENIAPASGAQGSGEVAAEEPSSQTEGDGDMTTGLKEQIYSFFQATDNKLSLKLYGNRGAVLREKVRQQLVGQFIVHPCSDFRCDLNLSLLYFYFSS